MASISVTELTMQIKAMLEHGFPLLDVEGEISGWKVYPSGHAYFTLKDEGAQISAVMFAGALGVCPQAALFKDGSKVKVRGGVSVYAQRGNYQFIVRRMKLLGEGDLMQQYLELKAKLEREGLFDPYRKKALPFNPKKIGIITSEAGAVIHDMVRVLTRRSPALNIRLFPCAVQGVETAASVIKGIEYFENEWQPELLIIARGGGSFEDLFEFNNETLVRRIAACTIPTICAIGHESDFSLSEFAADRRAGTPSIAAELAVPDVEQLRTEVEGLKSRMVASLQSKGEWFAQRTDHLQDLLNHSLMRYYEQLQTKVERAEERLKLLSPFGVLDRGYALVTTSDGSVARESDEKLVGSKVSIRLAKGGYSASLEGVI